MSTLAGFSNLEVYAELFNPNRANGLSDELRAELSKSAGFELSEDKADPLVVNFVRSNPALVLETMATIADPKVVVIKFFPSHLDVDFVAKDFLRRGDVASLMVKRRVIDVYASEEKAKISGTWSGSNTTSLAVEGDITHFDRWLTGKRRWFRDCGAVIEHSSQALTLHYEDQIDRGANELAGSMAVLLERVNIDVGRRERTGGLVKQDQTDQVADKFSNWDEFEQALHRADLHGAAFGYIAGGPVPVGDSL